MYLNGVPVVVFRDTKIQIRKHKKKRINKKWIKRYGYEIYPNTLLKDGEVLTMNDKFYMNERTFLKLKSQLTEVI